MICNVQMIFILKISCIQKMFLLKIIVHKIFLQVIFTKDVTNDNFTNDIKLKNIIQMKKAEFLILEFSLYFLYLLKFYFF